MIKAIFSDFYGTLVHEDNGVLKKISLMVAEECKMDIKEIIPLWGKEFTSICAEAYGDNFITQNAAVRKALDNIFDRLGSKLDRDELCQMMYECWRKPEILEGTREFLENAPLPVYVVSNIDTDDMKAALDFNKLDLADYFSSEDARSYKPRPEIFRYALEKTGLSPDEVIHIGDSIGNDVKGASAAGIKAVFLNRKGIDVPEGVISVNKLSDIWEIVSAL